MRETRKQVKTRLQAAGLWKDYLELREQLMREGQTPKRAKRTALQQIDSNRPATTFSISHVAPVLTASHGA
jgi:hypothetical protein